VHGSVIGNGRVFSFLSQRHVGIERRVRSAGVLAITWNRRDETAKGVGRRACAAEISPAPRAPATATPRPADRWWRRGRRRHTGPEVSCTREAWRNAGVTARPACVATGGSPWPFLGRVCACGSLYLLGGGGGGGRLTGRAGAGGLRRRGRGLGCAT
jgi:hypothetical protein